MYGLLSVHWEVAHCLKLVGQGGQIVMAFVAYKVCTKSLIRHMEVHAVPTGTFEAIAVQDHSMTGLIKLVQGAASNRNIRLIASMV